MSDIKYNENTKAWCSLGSENLPITLWRVNVVTNDFNMSYKVLRLHGEKLDDAFLATEANFGSAAVTPPERILIGYITQMQAVFIVLFMLALISAIVALVVLNKALM